MFLCLKAMKKCRAIFCVIAILSPPVSPLNVKSTMEVGFDYNIGMGNLEVCDCGAAC